MTLIEICSKCGNEKIISERVDKIKQHVCGATFAYCSGTKDDVWSSCCQ